jgi:hypothetical protein
MVRIKLKRKDGNRNRLKINMMMLKFHKISSNQVISMKKHKIGPSLSSPTTRNRCRRTKAMREWLTRWRRRLIMK